MKKLLFASAIIFGFLFQTLNGYAATQNPEEYHMFMVMRPTKSTMFSTIIQGSLNNTHKDSKDYEKALDKALAENDETFFAYKNENEGFTTMQVSAEKFQSIINLGGYNWGKKEKNYTIYEYKSSSEGEDYLSYFKNEMIIGPTEESVTNYINYGFQTGTNLSDLLEKIDPQSAFSIAIESDFFDAYDQSFTEKDIKEILIEFIQTSNSEFKIKIYTKFNNEPEYGKEFDNSELEKIIGGMTKNLEIQTKKISNTETETTITAQVDWQNFTTDFINFLSNKKSSFDDFKDVEKDAWYYHAVNKLKQEQTISSESEFYRPTENITRGEFVNMLVNYKGLDDYKSTIDATSIFNDIAGNIYTDDIATAYEIGLIQGDANGKTFRPNDFLNRAEAVKILFQASAILQSTQGVSTNFKDVPWDAWYKVYLEKAYAVNIVQGTSPTEFKPEKKLNRAEAAMLVYRLSLLD